MSAPVRYRRPDGASVLLWSARCGDCGFRSGLAEVVMPDQTKRMITGAGCRTRRDMKAARAWADSVV